MANPQGKGLIAGAHTTHGGWKWLRVRTVPEGQEDIAQGIQTLADGLSEEVTRNGEITPTQAVLIDRVCQLVGFTKLVERHAWEEGPIGKGEDGKPRMAAALRESYIAFSNSITRTLKALHEISANGTQGSGITLQAYIKQKEQEG